jgi:hypothetical protein
MARCPAHQERTPSFSIAEREGRVLLHCFAGCDQQAVIQALRARGLWPERRPEELSPDERKRLTRERAKVLRIADDIEFWRRALAGELDDEKAEALERADWPALERAASLHYKLTSGTRADVLELFILALIRDPGEVRRLIDAGRDDWRFSQEIGLFIVDCMAADARRPKEEQRLRHLEAVDAR